MNLRNLYWLREMQAERSPEVALLHKARSDAQALVDITKNREIGVPAFVIGGLLIPAGLSLSRLASGATREWWIALLVGAIGVAIGLVISWFVLRGAALASRRIRLSVARPARRALAHARKLRVAAEGPVTPVRRHRDLAHARRLDRPPSARDALALEVAAARA